MVAMTEAASNAFGTGGVTSVISFIRTAWRMKSDTDLLRKDYEAMAKSMDNVDSGLSEIRKSIKSLDAASVEYGVEIKNLVKLVDSQSDSIRLLCDTSHTHREDILQIKAVLSTLGVSVGSHTSTLADLASGQSVLREDMAGLGERVNSQVGTMGDLKEAMAGLEKKVDSHTSTMGDLREAMAGLGERVNSHTSTMDKMREDIASLEKKVDSQADALAGLEKKVDSQADALAGLEKKVDSQTGALAGLEKKVDSQTGALDKIHAWQAKTKAWQAKTDERLDKLHQSMATMQGSIDKLIKMAEENRG